MRNWDTGEDLSTRRKPVVEALVRSAAVEMTLHRALAGNAGVELRARHVEDIDLSDLLALRGDVLIVDIDPGSRQEFDLLADFVAQRRATPVIVTSPFLEVQSMCALMRIGVRHIVPQPVESEQLADAVAQALTQRQEVAETPTGPKGMVIGMLGSCGGVGTTSLAVQAACALARQPAAPTTCLLDLDLQFGGAALQLDVEPRGSVIDLIHEHERLDGAMLRGSMGQSARGKIDVLAAPTNFHPIENIEPERIAAVIEIASSEYQLTLLDLPLLWSHWTHAALRSADAIVLVTQPTVSALRQGKRQLDMLRLEELDDIPLTVILNRVETGLLASGGVTVKEAETALARKVDHVVPESASFAAAAQRGVPLGDVRGGRPHEKKIAAMFREIAQMQPPASAKPPVLRALRLPFSRGSFTPALALSR